VREHVPFLKFLHEKTAYLKLSQQPETVEDKEKLYIPVYLFLLHFLFIKYRLKKKMMLNLILVTKNKIKKKKKRKKLRKFLPFQW
jgi:hypothetical protein